MASKREELKAQQDAMRAAAARRRMIVIGITAAIAVILVAIVVWVVVAATVKKAEDAKQANTIGVGVPLNATKDNDGIIVKPGKAKADAPKVGLYFDYMCIHCHEFEKAFGAELDKLANNGQIELINHEMNFLDQGKLGFSTMSGVGAACADIQGKYEQYHDAVFAVQKDFSLELLRDKIPTEIGLSGAKLTAFQKCFDNKETLSFVEGMNKKAYEKGIDSTPTITVNGKKLDFKNLTNDPASLEKLIMEAAKK